MICFKKSDELKMLQKTRTPGNKFSGIQPKLEIGKVDDPHEKEADAVADKVMRMPSGDGSKVARMRDDVGAGVRMKPEAEEEKMPSEDETKIKMKSDPVYPLQKKPDGGNENSLAPETVEQGISSSKGSGQSLDAGIREEMGSKIGADFSDVKVHTDNNAAQMSKEIGAKAFAHGQDIYFNQGQYNPASSEGKHLLAHELTHTVQQGKSPALSPVRRTGPDADKADALMKYITKLRETGKIQNDKEHAREAIERWKVGHAVAVLTTGQKELLIKELLNTGSVPDTDQKLILDLVELSEVVNTQKLCVFLAPLIKSAGDATVDTKKAFSVENYKKFENIQATRAKEKSTSSGTFSSDKVRYMVERAYINAIRYAAEKKIDSDFAKFYDGAHYLHCIDTLRRVVLFNLYDASPDFPAIQKIVNEYCLSKDLKDDLGGKRSNRIMDAMDAMIKVGHAEKVSDFSFSQINKEYTGQISKSKKKTISEPDKLKTSVWQTMQDIIKEKEGWHVFPFTVLNGYHSITLVVNVRPGGPFLYWVDDLDKTKHAGSEQFRVTEGSAPGIRQIIPAELDNYINYTTQSYWSYQRVDPDKSEGNEGWHDENDTATLWHLNP